MPTKPAKPSFGELLGQYRERSVDRWTGKRLSQTSLASKLTKRRGLKFDRNHIGDWERDITTIPASDRKTLIDFVAIFVQYDGIATLDEANALLEAGNYRPLDLEETALIKPAWASGAPAIVRGSAAVPPDEVTREPSGASTPPQESMRSGGLPDSLEHAILGTWDGLQAILTATQEGPRPSWPRVFVALPRVILDRLTATRTLRALWWAWLWLVTWWLIAPSLRWPFDSRQAAFAAMMSYAAGTLVLPPFVAALVRPLDNKYWKEQRLHANAILHLYTYQGAGIGFHVGYFGVFLLTLLGFHFQLPSGAWSEIAAALATLVMSYVSAQLVPFNLWRAFDRLDLRDGAIFFIFLILGPAWGYFFFNFYTVFLAPIIGLVVILLAATFLAATMTWRQRQTGSTLIPVHWWSLFFGALLVLYEISIGANWYSVTSLAALIVTISVLAALGRVRFTVAGMLALLAAIGLLLIVLELDTWIGRIVAVTLLMFWWGWGKRFLSFPPAFWIVVLAIAACGLGVRQGFLSDALAAAVIALTSLLALLWERGQGLLPKPEAPH